MTVVNTTPVVRIYQEFLRIPTELTEDLLALIVAPHYFVTRHAEADELADGLLGSYVGAERVDSWPNRPAGGVVDQDWVSVWIDDALLQYFRDDLEDASVMQVGSTNNRIVASEKVFRTANGFSRSSDFLDRDVALGDTIRVQTGEGDVFWSTIAGFDYEEIAASLALVGADGADANNQGALTVGTTTPVTSGFTGVGVAVSAAAYDGLADGYPSEAYTITCVTAMSGSDPTTAELQVTSASGTDDVASVTPSASGVATDIGTRGATLTLTITPADTIEVGDSITVTFRQDYSVPTFGVNTAGTYTGTADRRYVVTVTGVNASGNPIVTVRTTAGGDNDGPIAIALGATYVAVGSNGVQIRFVTGGTGSPVPGDKFYVDATAAADGACDTLIMSRMLPDTINADVSSSVGGESVPGDTPADLDVTLYIKEDIEVPRYSVYPLENWETSATQITLNDSIQVYHSSWTDSGVQELLPVMGGTAYVQYRALLPTYITGRSSITGAAEALSTVGPAIVQNPLGLAVYTAALNANEQPVGFIAVETDDLAGYTAALELIKDDRRCYSLVPTTQLATIQDVVESHVDAQSTADRGRFRIAWLNSASNQVVLVTDEDEDEESLTAQFEIDPDNDNDVLLVTSAAGQFITDAVAANDIVRANYGVDEDGEETYDTYVVDVVISEDQLRLVSGPDAATAVEDKIEIWRTQTGSAEATTYAALATGFNNRRVRHIWPPSCTLSDGTTAPGWVLCAGLAGLRSGAAPHQPLTNVEINGISAVPRTTDDMREADLDIMAEDGTWIITQDVTGGACFTRLALGTDVTDANRWQDHRTTNVDSISFGFYNRLKDLVGSTNITERTLQFIANEIKAVSKYFESEARTPDLGPQLLSLEIVEGPEQHETLRDTVIIRVNITVPYELVAIELYLYVS